MKLKYYLRGMGIGIILTAIVMGFALGGRKAAISDAQIIERARALGMVEAGNGVLLETAEGVNGSNENDTSSSGKTSDKEGGPVFEEVKPEVSGTDTSVSEVPDKKEKAENESQASGKSASSSEKTEDSAGSESTDQNSINSGDTKEAEEKTDVSSENVSAVESSADNSKIQETALGEELSEINGDSSAGQAPSELSEPQVPSKSVTIPGGTSSDGVAQILYNAGFIDNAVTFNRYLIETGKDRIIRSGVKTIPEGATYEQIASIITKG